jgi:hypothetical protein
LRKRSNLPRRAWATVLASCAHLLALLFLGWRIPKVAEREPASDRSAAVEVTLVRPSARPRARPTAEAPRPAPSAPPSASPRVLIAPTPGAPPLTAPEPAPPAPPDAGAKADDQRVQNTLRGLVGCADTAAYRLTREERAACDQRLAAATPAPVGKPYSAEELAQFDAENRYDPILARRPHNGCLPGAGDRPASDAHVSARGGATTAFGLRCAWSFR